MNYSSVADFLFLILFFQGYVSKLAQLSLQYVSSLLNYL